MENDFVSISMNENPPPPPKKKKKRGGGDNINYSLPKIIWASAIFHRRDLRVHKNKQTDKQQQQLQKP